LNSHILPAGVKVVPFIDRSDLVHYTTDTVLHNLREGIMLVVVVLFLFLGNVRGAIIVALTINAKTRLTGSLLGKGRARSPNFTNYFSVASRTTEIRGDSLKPYIRWTMVLARVIPT